VRANTYNIKVTFAHLHFKQWEHSKRKLPSHFYEFRKLDAAVFIPANMICTNPDIDKLSRDYLEVNTQKYCAKYGPITHRPSHTCTPSHRHMLASVCTRTAEIYMPVVYVIYIDIWTHTMHSNNDQNKTLGNIHDSFVLHWLINTQPRCHFIHSACRAWITSYLSTNASMPLNEPGNEFPSPVASINISALNSSCISYRCLFENHAIFAKPIL